MTERSEAAILLDKVSKSYGDTRVLDDISLAIARDEFVVFLGSSGCGKSTLLRIIAGLESLDSGQVRIGEKRIDHLPPGERGVAMVFQHYALYPHMSVRENMSFGLKNVGVAAKAIDERVQAAAAMLEITSLLDRKPSQISGGQRQRVAIGRAIVKEPQVFLFDEPLSNLDAALRLRTRLEIAELHRRVNAATIFVTHDQVEAMTLADRIVIINDRRIEQVGTPMEIYTRPATEFVATFVGSPPMNFIAVEKKTDGAVTVVRLPDGAEVATQIPAGAVEAASGLKLGVRAESIRVCAAGSGDTNGTAKFVERLGDRTLVHVALDDGMGLIVEDAGLSRVQTGDRVGLQFDAAALHLFAGGRGYHAEVATGS